MFFGKKILVGVTGGIAAYKTAELVRLLKTAHVRVVMTPAARQFVSPLTFQVLSENDVLTDLFEKNSSRAIHIEWARWAELLVVCPATANTVAKVAAGIADNALTTIITATEAPVVFCPAMNKVMYENPVYCANEEKLKQMGYHFITPGAGELACGESGAGRLAEPPDIADYLLRSFAGKNDLIGKKVLVTAGPTREPFDPARFISNPSSGKMGYAVARCAARRGAQVTLISGPTFLDPPDSVERVYVNTASEMLKAVVDHIRDMDVLVMAAAVSDYRPAEYSTQKIKKSKSIRNTTLERTTDILAHVGKNKKNRLHVGFSVETQNEIENSRKKLKAKNIDLIAINNPLESGAGFQSDDNHVTLLDRHDNIEKLPFMSKTAVADKLLDKILELLNE